MLGEPENQFSLTRVAQSTGGRAKSKFLSVSVSPCRAAVMLVALVTVIWSSGCVDTTAHRKRIGRDLEAAIEHNNLGSLKKQLKDHPWLMPTLTNHGGLLCEAVRYGHKEMVELLLANGFNVNATNITGRTALQEATGYQGAKSRRDCKAVVELLLAHKADVNAKDWFGYAPLHNVAWYSDDDKEMVELLLAHKANANAKTKEGETPVDLALKQRHFHIVELLANPSQLQLASIVRNHELYIERGDPESIEAMIKALDTYGDYVMAADYLNCGNSRLAMAARRWAYRHKYTIESRTVRGPTGFAHWGQGRQ